MKFRDEELCFLVHTLGFEVYFVPSHKICLCPPPPPQSRYPGAVPDLQIAKTIFCDMPPKCWHLVGQIICWLSGHRPQYTSRTARRTVNTSMQSKIYFASTVNSIKFIARWELDLKCAENWTNKSNHVINKLDRSFSYGVIQVEKIRVTWIALWIIYLTCIYSI